MAHWKIALALACAGLVGWGGFQADKLLEPRALEERAEGAVLSRSPELSGFFTRNKEALGRLDALECSPEGKKAAPPYWVCKGRDRGSSLWFEFVGARETKVAPFAFRAVEERGRVEVMANPKREFADFKEVARVMDEVARRVNEERDALDPLGSGGQVARSRLESWSKADQEDLASVRSSEPARQAKSRVKG